MDKMKQEAESKLKYWGRMCALFTILMATNFWNYFRPISENEHFTDFFQGFQLGVAMGFLACAIFQVIRYRKILRDEEALKAYYIKEHDERNMAIWNKSGGTVLYTCGILIIGAAIVAGYFNPIVFITLLVCGIFLLLVKKGLCIYYRRTM